MPRSRRMHGFTIVEILVVIALVGIIASIAIIAYGNWQRKAATTSVQSDMHQAASGISSYKNFKNDYPPNLAGIGFAASESVALTLRTNAPQLRTYTGLTPEQNAQLFLNSCNASMPIVSSGTTYNTTCTFAGNNIHVKGANGSNVVIQGPTIQSSDIALICGAACSSAVSQMITYFSIQNGTFPLSVPKQQSILPNPTLTTYGAATKFCLEGRSSIASDVVYYRTSINNTAQVGACPADPELHYP